jgi:hypothetical protein
MAKELFLFLNKYSESYTFYNNCKKKRIETAKLHRGQEALNRFMP